MLEKREKHLEKQVLAARAQAKEKLRLKDKRGAIQLLKRAKMLDAQINQNYGKKANIDVQIMALEGAHSNAEIFRVMQQGKDALKRATQDTDVDKVADVMEDINEQIQMADEVNEAMSQPIGPVMDEDELNQELEEMENELIDQQLLEAPDAPKDKIRVPTTGATVTASSSPAVSASSSSSSTQQQQAAASSASSSASQDKKLSEKEQKEMKELEALMGM